MKDTSNAVVAQLVEH